MADGKKSTGYVPQSGMTAEHFKVVQEAAKSQNVIAVVRNTNTASTPLIQKGCPGKPGSVSAHTDVSTGVVTAANRAETLEAYKAGFFVVEKDGVARREAAGGPKQELKLSNAFWRVAPGQIIDPESKKPLVGDYDLHGVIDPKATGRNVALVASNGVKLKNVESPIVKAFRTKVNAKLDQDRMLHGAQDQYASFRGGATVFHPDGSVEHLATEAEVREFYKSIGRETRLGRYKNPKGGPPGNIPVIPWSSGPSGMKGILSNQEIMGAAGVMLEAAIQWVGDYGIQRDVSNRLKTQHAKAIDAELKKGNGVLVIIGLQEWEQEDFNGFRARTLLNVYIEPGPDEETAKKKWLGTPKLLQGPASGWRSREEYGWIEPLK